MEKPKFDITYRRKLLYKRKRRREIIFRFSLLLICIIVISLFLLFSKKSSVNKNITTSTTSNESTDTKIIVCIDPGHGDWDTGAKGLSGSLEKDIVLDISLKLGNLLEDNGVKVVYTRTNDSLSWLDNSNDSLKERIKFAEVLKSNLFVSIHCNSDYGDEDSKGVETWYKAKDENSKNLALAIQNSLINANYTEDRKIKTYNNKEDALAVLELNSSIPVLLELGFLSNQSDERYLKSDKGQDAIVIAIKNALLSYIEENKNTILKEKQLQQINN